MSDPELPKPSVRMALICERALLEHDGVLSVIRMIDQINVRVHGVGTPETMPPQKTRFMVASSWTGGLGSHRVKTIITGPGDAHLELPEMPFHLSSLDRGHNLIAEVELPITSEGLYWVNFELDGESVSRIPLRVIYLRVEFPPLQANG